MTSSLSGSTDIRRMRGPAWGVGLVAVGVFAGLVVAFVARGDGLAAAAALVDPSHGVTADVVSAVPVHQAPTVTAQGLSRPQSDREGAIVQPLPTKLAAPSCNADAVVPVAVAKVEAPTPHEPVVTYVAPVAPVAPRTIAVRHVEAPREPTQVAVVPPPVTKPIKVGRRAGNEVESASAADALAKAQLEAALSR
jgi:hypothetical protein